MRQTETERGQSNRERYRDVWFVLRHSGVQMKSRDRDREREREKERERDVWLVLKGGVHTDEKL